MSSEHTGVDSVQDIPRTYEHVDGPPEPSAPVFRVTAYIEYVDLPIHQNTYYVPAPRLDGFLKRSVSPQFAERVVDVQPMTAEQAESEVDEYRDHKEGEA